MNRPPLAALFLALFALGCGHSRSEARAKPAEKNYPDVPNMNEKRWANAQDKAAKELGVDPAKLNHESLGNGRFLFHSGVLLGEVAGTGRHVYDGGAQVEYALYCVGWSCVWLDDPRARAEFDLNCPRQQLAISYLSEVTRGIAGCDKRATYVAKVSPNYEVTWLMNSAGGN